MCRRIGLLELLHLSGEPPATNTARRLDDLEQGGVGRQGRMPPQQFHASGAENVLGVGAFYLTN